MVIESNERSLTSACVYLWLSAGGRREISFASAFLVVRFKIAYVDFK